MFKELFTEKIQYKVGDLIRLKPLYLKDNNKDIKIKSDVYKIIKLQDDMAYIENINDNQKITIYLDMIKNKVKGK